MNEQERRRRLRQLLSLKIPVTFFLWGFPIWWAPAWFLEWMSLPVPADPLWLRLFGASTVAAGFAHLMLYQDPDNWGLAMFGVLENGLVTLTVLYLGLTRGITSWFVWGSAGLTAYFAIALFWLRPGRHRPST